MKEHFKVTQRMKRGVRIAGLALAFTVCGAMAWPGGTSRLIRKADQAFELEDYKAALKLYASAVEAEPSSPEANYKLGITYVQLNMPKEARAALQRAIDLDAKVEQKLLLPLAEANHLEHNFSAAKAYYEQEKRSAPTLEKTYQELLRKRIAECQAGEDLMRLPAIYNVSNVGSAINSEYSDYVPVLMPDDKAMLFTTRRPDKGRKSLDANGAEQIRITRMQQGNWQESELFLETQQQMPQHAVVSVAPHGKELYTFFADKGLHVSYKLQSGDWTQPELLKAPFNQGSREPSLFVTDDGKFAFFSSDRTGGYGGLDLYVSYKKEDGSWSEALNLGPEVNTPYDEDAPFVDTATNTLYFSSRGHNTMGGYDIFRSSISNATWSKARNLGYPVNSAADDLYFTLSSDRSTAYISSDRPGGAGEKDIYRILFH
ncbi:tetratricopeptide repeat protein [Pontibacter oryzae]|uniref:Tetratricopeptide repeat protein n=1 Tax=Pontibacter oryzae TaxID=2304593 RepID=A0A399S3K5_9BACT|nr:tetratricopeptide repeat protein [Pontibacter oryzae]RIJ37049.1 tetratricopeptide repeat protein [Pontibacter oryzae]